MSLTFSLLSWVIGWLVMAVHPPTRVDFLPDSIACMEGQQLSVRASVTRNGAPVQGARVNFFTKNADVARVIRKGDRTGTLFCAAPGKTFVGSGYKGVRDSTLARVRPDCSAFATLTLTPDTIVLASVGASDTISASLFNDCNKQDTLQTVSFVSRNASVGSIASVGPQRVVVTAVAAGVTSVVGTIGSLKDSTYICVAGGHDVAVAPASIAVDVGGDDTFTATITDCAGPAAGTVTWSIKHPSIASISPSGNTVTVTGVAEGTTYGIATFSGVKDSGQVQVSPASTPAYSSCDDLPTPLRTVNVSTSSQLSAARSSALPGDRIVLAPGSYAGTSLTGKNGTSTNPIVICGPRTAVVSSGLSLTNSAWWIYQGFTLYNGFQPLLLKNVDNSRMQGLLIRKVGQEAVHLLCGAADNVMAGNTIDSTGTSVAQYGEGFYVGTDPSNRTMHCGSSTDNSTNNVIEDNIIGPRVTGEAVDIKPNADGTILRRNTFDRTGSAFIDGFSMSCVTLRATGVVLQENTCTIPTLAGTKNGFHQWGTGSGATYHDNVITGVKSDGWGFKIDSGSWTLDCDNSVTPSGRFSNRTCT